MPDWPDTPNFHPDYCLKVIKRTGVACSLVVVTVLIILIAGDPSRSSCPGWYIRAKSGAETSLWLLFVWFTVLPTLWLWYVILRWNTFAQKQHDIITGQRRTAWGSPALLPFINMDQLMVIVGVCWFAFCSIILWVMIDYCTDWPRQLWAHLPS